MAGVPKAQNGLAAILEVPPGSLARNIAELRAAGMLPNAKGAPLGAEHLTSFTLSLGADRPRHIAAVVRALEKLPYTRSEPADAPPPGLSLGLAFANMLHKLAEPFSRREEPSPDSVALIESMEMVFCYDTLEACISMDEGKDQVHYFYSANKGSSRPPLRRVTVITGAVWMAMGYLLADTYINDAAIQAIQFLDRTKHAKASNEDENAGDLRQEAPASSYTNQSPAKGSVALVSTDTNGGMLTGEASRNARTGHDSTNEPDLFNSVRSVHA